MCYKKTLSLCCLSLLFFSPCFAAPKMSADAQEELLKQVSHGFSKVAKKATPAVVYIETDVEKESKLSKQTQKGPFENPFDFFQDDFFNRFFGFPSESKPKKSETVRGSGFIFSNDGYIITNNHVVENAKKISVTMRGGKKVTATLVGSDPKTDLAVIKIEDKNLSHLTFGNSDDLEVGSWVIAVGNPFGLEASVTVGVVSAKGRNQLHITDFEDFIQTDAAINPGNSGGPLLNIDGDVIGINTAIVSGSGGYMGIGFAIPSNMASRIVDQLIKKGTVTRGFLGVTLQPVDDDLAGYYKLTKIEGALVTNVIKDSPADKAGLKQEDIIIAYNNSDVDSLSSFRNAVSLMAPGTKLSLRIIREGNTKDLVVTIGTSPENAPVATLPVGALQKLGLKVQNLSSDMALQLGYTEQSGVLVTEVSPDGSCHVAGIRSGDLIMAINRNKIANIEEFTKAIEKGYEEGRVLLMVRHLDSVRFVVIQLDEDR